MYIDTHLHLENNENIKSIIQEACNNNVKKLIISGCDKKGIIDAVEIINDNTDIYATIGFHPSEIELINDDDIKWLENLIINNEKIIGLGEIGLDYHYNKDNKERQINLFEKQLQLAEKLNMPVVIHSRDAFRDTYDLLKKYKIKGIIHCFSGSLEVANLYIKLGYVLGIGGVLTFKNSKLDEVIKNISLEHIVLETDSPYLAPDPHRGEENFPKFIPIIAEKISKIKKISTKEVEKITCSNVNRIFDLKI